MLAKAALVRSYCCIAEHVSAVVLEQLFAAVQCMHMAGVVHRDLEPKHFLRANGRLQIIDLGCAAPLPQASQAPEAPAPGGRQGPTGGQAGPHGVQTRSRAAATAVAARASTVASAATAATGAGEASTVAGAAYSMHYAGGWVAQDEHCCSHAMCS